MSLWSPEQAAWLLENQGKSKQLLKLVPIPHLPANHWGCQDLTLILVGSASGLEATEGGRGRKKFQLTVSQMSTKLMFGSSRKRPSVTGFYAL